MVKRPFGVFVEGLRHREQAGHELDTTIGKSKDVGRTAAIAVRLDIADAVDDAGLVEDVQREPDGAFVVLVRLVAAQKSRNVVCAKAEIFCEDFKNLFGRFCKAECWA